MPRVPVYGGPRVAAQGLPDLQQRVRAEPTAANEGLGLDGLGQGLIALGQSQGLDLAERQGAALEEEAQFLAAESRAEALEATLFDPKRGFLAASGPEAKALRQTALQDYESGLEQLGAGFSDPRLRAVWQQIAAGRRAAVRARVAEAGLQQTAGWLQEERGRRVEQRLATALSSLGDPERQARDRELLAFEAEHYARAQGMDDAESQDYVAGRLGAVHAAAVSALLDDGRPDEAGAYLAEQRQELPPALAGELEAAIGEELHRGEVEARAQALLLQVAGEGDVKEPEALFARARSRVEAIADAEERDLVGRRIEALRRAAEAPAPVDPEREAAQGEAYRAVSAGANPDDLAPAVRRALGPEGREQLRAVFDRGPERATDWQLYARLSALAPEALAASDLFAQAAALAPDEFDLLQQRQEQGRQALQGDGREAARLASAQRRRDSLLTSLGLSAESEEAGRVLASIDRALLDAERAAGKPLDPAAERRALQEGYLAAVLRPNALASSPPDPDHLDAVLPDLPEPERTALFDRVKGR